MFNSHVKFSEWSEIPGGNTCDEAAAMFTAGLMFGVHFLVWMKARDGTKALLLVNGLSRTPLSLSKQKKAPIYHY